MPDHIHLFLTGLCQTSDQRLALKMLRAEINRHLRPRGFELQKQPYDDVRREATTDRFSYQSTSHYILENPVRKGLAATSSSWPFQGALFPGCPNLDPHQPNFWDRFWKAYQKAADGYASEDRGSSATVG